MCAPLNFHSTKGAFSVMTIDTGQCASLDARVGKLQPTESPLNDLRDSYYFIFIRGSKCLWIKKVGA